MAGPTPQLVALLLCDQAFQQAETRNWCVIGAFDWIRPQSLPFTHPAFVAWVALSDFSGGTTVQLVIRDQAGEVVKAVRGKVPELPLGLFQHAFPFQEVEFRNEGVHTLELFAGDELITLRSFRVQSVDSLREVEGAAAERLAEQHRASLAHEAAGVWKQQPEARLSGLIAAPDAAEADFLRGMLPSAVPAGLPVVGLLPRELIERILHEKAPQLLGHLDRPAPAAEGRWLPILIATRHGFEIAHQLVEG